jgi:hypothetical protein
MWRNELLIRIQVAVNNGEWCKGSTGAFGTPSSGSNPGSPVSFSKI